MNSWLVHDLTWQRMAYEPYRYRGSTTPRIIRQPTRDLNSWVKSRRLIIWKKPWKKPWFYQPPWNISFLAPENWWLEDEFLSFWGLAHFQGRTASFRECNRIYWMLQKFLVLFVRRNFFSHRPSFGKKNMREELWSEATKHFGESWPFSNLPPPCT